MKPKKEMLYEGRLVEVMSVNPTGIWAMVRVKGYGATMPFVVRVKELTEPAISDYGKNIPGVDHIENLPCPDGGEPVPLVYVK